MPEMDAGVEELIEREELVILVKDAIIKLVSAQFDLYGTEKILKEILNNIDSVLEEHKHKIDALAYHVLQIYKLADEITSKLSPIENWFIINRLTKYDKDTSNQQQQTTEQAGDA